jgi:hypothetical protein
MILFPILGPAAASIAFGGGPGALMRFPLPPWGLAVHPIGLRIRLSPVTSSNLLTQHTGKRRHHSFSMAAASPSQAIRRLVDEALEGYLAAGADHARPEPPYRHVVGPGVDARFECKCRCGSGQVPPVRVRAIRIPGRLVLVGAGMIGVAPVQWAVRRAAEPLAKRADVEAAMASAVFIPTARGLCNGRSAKDEGNRKNNPGQHGISPMCLIGDRPIANALDRPATITDPTGGSYPGEG